MAIDLPCGVGSGAVSAHKYCVTQNVLFFKKIGLFSWVLSGFPNHVSDFDREHGGPEGMDSDAVI